MKWFGGTRWHSTTDKRIASNNSVLPSPMIPREHLVFPVVGRSLYDRGAARVKSDERGNRDCEMESDQSAHSDMLILELFPSLSPKREDRPAILIRSSVDPQEGRVGGS